MDPDACRLLLLLGYRFLIVWGLLFVATALLTTMVVGLLLLSLARRFRGEGEYSCGEWYGGDARCYSFGRGIFIIVQIEGNLICGNDGAGIYLFKPDGSTTLTGQ